MKAYDAAGNSSDSSNVVSGAVSTLKAGNYLLFSGGRLKLVYQGDGNLVLYRMRDHVALWSSGTCGTKPGKTVMQGDGNLVIYDASGAAKWASNTEGHSGSRLVAQNDGNVVIYDVHDKPLWATGTQGK